ncbi:MAG TPA: HYR domain-containing protein, partial [Taishania sp.]|nr:HYR domain-containing protein [Taishania sp.]
YTATDASGNTATCSFNVTVEDTEAPTVIVCPNDTIVYVGATNCEVEVTWIEPEFTDNCELTVTSTRANGSTFNVGLTTVTYTAVDGSGNIATCSFNVIVMDTIAPIISITDLVATSCSNTGITWNEELTDNCSIETIQRSHTSGSVFEVGTTTVTYVVTDVNGNITTYSFDVTVDDVEQVELATSIVKQCVGNTVVLTVLNPNSDYTYTWYENGVSVGTGNELVFANASTSVSGIYTVVATSPNGCTSEENVQVIVENCGIIISETFSPNGDGSNDYFHIEGLENYPGTEVWIHNRWGVQVYHNPNYQNDWDGRSQSKLNVGGDELPEGTYYYILKLGGEAGTPNAGEIYKGFIYIKR